MLRRVLRSVLIAGLALAVWTFARPAYAAPAPYCDDRGASAIAQPPVLEAPDVAVQRARLSTQCVGEDMLLFHATIAPGHARLAMPGSDAQHALCTPPVFPPPIGCGLLDPTPLQARPCSGVRSRVERPPRG
jgi:hypothetical protein